MRIEEIRRHPIKGIGWERIAHIGLAPNRPLPGDRAWAVAHARAPKSDGWQPKSRFLQSARGPSLMAVTARGEDGAVTLSHPDRPTARFALPEDGAALLDWLAPLWPDDEPRPDRLVAAPQEGMSDTGAPLLHIVTHASLDALMGAAGTVVDVGRFRANLILSGTDPWAEFGWIGRRMRAGHATLEVVERTGRCRATEADPATGVRDLDVLSILQRAFGHADFGVYARVVEGGAIAEGDAVALL